MAGTPGPAAQNAFPTLAVAATGGGLGRSLPYQFIRARKIRVSMALVRSFSLFKYTNSPHSKEAKL